MTPADYLLSAAAQAGSVIFDLIEAAREDDPTAAIYQGDDIVQRLADALKLTLEAAPTCAEPEADEAYVAAKADLHAACVKFLEGWA